jgi:uncharacterized protein YjiK
MFLIIHLLNLISVVFINSSNNQAIPFNISNPELKIELSKELKEISGLTWLGNNEIGAVQDEAGILYILDASSGKIKNKIKFSLPGDFEGITVAGTCIYAITSSGMLYYFDRSSPNDIKRVKTPLSWRNDVEGLFYDEDSEQLLVICKENGSISDSDFKGKSIFSIRTSDHYFSKTPLVTIKKKELEKFKKVEKFKPSAIDIDPLTKDIYILASAGKILLVLNSNYTIKTVINLPSKLYAQPEGICFSNNGDLFISNEGKKGNATFYHLKRSR